NDDRVHLQVAPDPDSPSPPDPNVPHTGAKRATRPAKRATRPAKRATRPAKRATRPAKRATRPAKRATRPAKRATRPGGRGRVRAGGAGLLVVGAYVVFEDHAGDHEQDYDGGDGDQPGVEERQRYGPEGGAQPEPEGPVAAGAEEAELAGAV